MTCLPLATKVYLLAIACSNFKLSWCSAQLGCLAIALRACQKALPVSPMMITEVACKLWAPQESQLHPSAPLQCYKGLDGLLPNGRKLEAKVLALETNRMIIRPAFPIAFKFPHFHLHLVIVTD